MQSLDLANVGLESMPDRLQAFLPVMERAKARLQEHGYTLYGTEPLKITIDAGPFGYTGDQLAEILLQENIVSEFHDPDYVVFMCTPDNTPEEMEKVCEVLCKVEQRPVHTQPRPPFDTPERVISIREAVMRPSETVAVTESAGRVLAQSTVGCPPAIPIVMSGERISENSARLMQYYGIQTVQVVGKE